MLLIAKSEKSGGFCLTYATAYDRMNPGESEKENGRSRTYRDCDNG